VKSLLMRVAAAILPLLLAACASGPKFTEVQRSFPALRSGEARIFLYRSASPVGAALQPTIRLNGQAVGSLAPGGFLFVDRPAGTFTVTAATEAESTVQFTARGGDSVYVEMSMSMGVLVWRPQLRVRGSEALSDLAGLAYVGAVPVVPGSPASGGRPERSAAPPGRPAAPVTMDDLSGLLPPGR
jgi:hypothetical protein